MVYIHSRLNRGRPYTPSSSNPVVTNLVAKLHGIILGFIPLVRQKSSGENLSQKLGFRHIIVPDLETRLENDRNISYEVFCDGERIY